MNRPQSFSTFASPAKAHRPQSSDGVQQENMWSSLLDNVASGKRLPEKNIIVLGGTAEMQKDFLATLDSDAVKKPQEKYRKKPQVANEFALGYTYQDVLDADQEDILARLSIYTLQQPSPSFAPLVKPLLSAQAIPETLLIILLDWAEPWTWVRRVLNWIRLLHSVLTSLDEDAKTTMQEVMKEWEQRRRGASEGTAGGSAGGSSDANVSIPLGPGEWDEALGLPLCVVCHNSDKIDMLEREHGWREEVFDYVLQFLRTILLKHGASLIYTSGSAPNSLPLLVQSSLGIHSLLNRQSLRHNVVDRDRILIPPNWDSWGKIRVLREGFDVEGISEGWSLDIQLSGGDSSSQDPKAATEKRKTTVSLYEETIEDPNGQSSFNAPLPTTNTLELDSIDVQEFLARQAETMERLKMEEEKAAAESVDPNNKNASLSHGAGGLRSGYHTDGHGHYGDGRSEVNEHIGPVQFNMGGIQVDAEDMLKRLRERERDSETPDREVTAASTTTPASTNASAGAGSDGKPQQNEALANFFAGLIKRGGSNSPKPQQQQQR